MSAKQFLLISVVCGGLTSCGQSSGGERWSAVEQAAQLTQDEIVQLARNAFTVSWLPTEDKDSYVDALEAYAAEPS